ncbi:MAG TPA: ABC transporter substrate-binding protein [Nocardioidaceae bacterium]|nr:ABC transporter substrate-binding protein [Nocardioidaceae bacterium]
MRRRLLALAGAGVLAASLAACGGDTGSGGGGGEGGGGSAGGGAPWILGTTDTVTSLDPAGAYDLGSWTLQYQMYQRLLTIPAGENTPQGDAAESCEYENPSTLTCTLKNGLQFSNGNPLTSSDVKFSLERNINIADPNGASVLLGSLMNEDGSMAPNAIETPDERTVTFNLTKPDTTFQFVLTTNAAAIVDEDTFPAAQKVANAQAVGSGPFQLAQYEDGNQAVLDKSETYSGPNEAQSSRVFVKYYKEPSALKLAAENGEVDVAWRSLSPTDIEDLKQSDSVQVLEGEGSEIRYFVWQLGTQMGGEKAVRQAVAELIDREAIAQRAYDGTVEPLYSIVPPGFPGQIDAFRDKYGDNSVDQARQMLQSAGIQTPVNLTLGYTPSHYGPAAVDEATELKRQLDASGLFNVSLKSAEWTQYQELYKQNAYDLFQLGWFPDYLDADNYLSPFFVDGGFYENNYSNPQVNQLVAKEQGASEDAVREQTFQQLQRIVAEDVPLIPSWVGKNTAVVNPAMQGVEETLDPSFIFRMWTVSKSEG